MAGLDEIRRVIREQEPQKPSTRLKHDGRETARHVAQHRQIGPAEADSA